MKKIDDLKEYLSEQDLDILRASRLKSDLYKDPTIYKKREREILRNYSFISRLKIRFRFLDLILALFLLFAFFNYLVFYTDIFAVLFLKLN